MAVTRSIDSIKRVVYNPINLVVKRCRKERIVFIMTYTMLQDMNRLDVMECCQSFCCCKRKYVGE
ncbi:MAG: hypothetical protein IJ535_10370 [Pseudobutyrivibrio sp.]|uniref:hypothetical protein n=1 Tax=Pseudobutyrivibrio sp. TaxID=2014367 RepID=UPI0025F660F6|nr:hypothetical protein [Pseudobutyrivibrio sp.]MBQ8490170.1 hypothetical protein [Pseudobutyrivibrio sp.]